MSRPVRLYDLGPSPNNMKARLALAYKKIPYEKIPVDPQDRRAVIEASGQPLTPVLLHGDTVVYDSYAITRYLDANWPKSPRLYSADRETMKKIEEWENFTRSEGSAPIGACFAELFAPEKNADRLRKANENVNRVAARVEEALAKRPFLLGDAPTAADFALAPMQFYGAVPEAYAERNPVAAFFRKHLKIAGAPRTLDWISRVMEWDR